MLSGKLTGLAVQTYRASSVFFDVSSEVGRQGLELARRIGWRKGGISIVHFGLKLCVGGVMMALPDGTSTSEFVATRAAADWAKAEELFRHQHV